MGNQILQTVLFILLLVLAAWPLGHFMWFVMEGKKNILSPAARPIERIIYKVSGIDPEEEMTWKQYLAAVLTFSAAGLVFLFLMQLLQGLLPLNPAGQRGVSWHLALNT